MRILATDLPLIQQAMGLYIKQIEADPSLPTLAEGTQAYVAVHDGMENAKRLLARANEELATAAKASAAL